MGITFDQTAEKFVFDFEHDGKNDIISLTGQGYEVEAFGECFHYAYEFSEQVESSVRSEFIKYLKFTNNLKDDPDLTQFIQRAIDNFSKQVNLYKYDLVIMPESSSKVNQYMLRYLYRFAQPMLRPIELVKALPSSIQFDMDGYEKQYLNDVLENGRARYTEAQKEEVKASIENQNVLIIDDIATSGSTLNEVLRTLRIINDKNNLTIFSLLGRSDLMADSI